MLHPIAQNTNLYCSFQSLLFKGLLLLLMTAFIQNLNAQSNASLATQAAQLCQEKNLDDAMAKVQLALSDETEKNVAYTWYVYGFVCKEIYKTRESNTRNSSHRMLAIDAFLKAEKMQNNGDVSTSAPLRYLVNTMYNDALMSTSEITLGNEASADSLFAAYRSIALQSMAQSETEIKTNEAQFIKAKAQQFYDLWSNQPEETSLINRAIELYSQMLDLNPTDCITIYNIGVAYFNQAILQARQEGIDAMEMTRTQIAHTYFEKAAQICPDDIRVQKALQASSNDQTTEKTPSKKLSLKKK
jgi:hypothetical protein